MIGAAKGATPVATRSQPVMRLPTLSRAGSFPVVRGRSPNTFRIVDPMRARSIRRLISPNAYRAPSRLHRRSGVEFKLAPLMSGGRSGSRPYGIGGSGGAGGGGGSRRSRLAALEEKYPPGAGCHNEIGHLLSGHYRHYSGSYEDIYYLADKIYNDLGRMKMVSRKARAAGGMEVALYKILVNKRMDESVRLRKLRALDVDVEDLKGL